MLRAKRAGEEKMSARISQRFFSIVIKAAFIFEPLAPRALSFYLAQRLKNLKKRGIVSELKSRVRRLGKFHYKIEVDLNFTAKQANYVLGNLLPNQIKRVGRWINVGR
jgi:hypothetical protein